MGKWNSPNLSEKQGFQCFWHSNWTICSLLSCFCPKQFPTFSLSYWGANSYYPRERKAENGKMEFSQPEWETRNSVALAFKLDHLQPVKLLLSQKISNFLTFILGSPFLLPQRANFEKGEFSQLPIWMRQRGFSAWGIQTGPFAAL